MLLFTKMILSRHNDLPKGTLLHYLNVKPKCLCSRLCPPVDCSRKKKLTQPFLRLVIPGGSCNINGFSLLLTSPPLCSIKEPGSQTPTRWSFWDISLLSSLYSGFLNKLLFLDSIPHLWFIGLASGEERHLGLDNNITWSKAGWHKQHYVLEIINTSLSLKFRALEGSSDRRWLKNKAGSDPKRSYVSC